MSFGLFTAINVDDVPKILSRVAINYRGSEGYHQHLWQLVADEIERFSVELQKKIDTAKKSPPKRPRVVIAAE